MTESPKALFIQAHADAAKELSRMSKERPMRLGVMFALSQMVADNATKEQLDGAKEFATTLMTLGDPIDAPPSFPDKSLKN